MRAGRSHQGKFPLMYKSDTALLYHVRLETYSAIGIYPVSAVQINSPACRTISGRRLEFSKSYLNNSSTNVIFQ